MPTTLRSDDPTGEHGLVSFFQNARKARMTPAEPEQKSAAAEPTFKAAYVSDEGTIYALAATAGTIDLDDDVLQTKAMLRMAADFTSAPSRCFKANHADSLEADLVGSLCGRPILKSGRVLSFGESLPSDDPMVGISLEGQPTAWLVAIRPKDAAVLELAKAGGIAGLSWGAHASRTEIEPE
jgi:hypothetical protein